MSRKWVSGIASQSLGCPQYHGIRQKLQAVADAGLQAVEIFFEDIAQLAQQHSSQSDVLAPQFQPLPSGTTLPQFTSDDERLVACARQIGQWCLDTQPHSIEVICLQPFMHYEGLLDAEVHKQRIQKLHLWIHIAKALGTDLIQIPSNFLSPQECTGDRSRIVADLKEVAEIGARQTPIIRFAHEALCWGTHTDTWDAAWEIVKAVDMENFGTCLDTFNIAGRVYADPTRANGKNALAEVEIAASIQRLRDTFKDPRNLKKVFYIELCDGEALDIPIGPSHPWYNAEQPARMTWSRNARLFPFETNATEAAEQGRNVGYLPVNEIFDALLEVGFEGYISFEVFNRSLNQPGENVVRDHTERARKSWKQCSSHIEHFLKSQSTTELPDKLTASTINADDIATLRLDLDEHRAIEQSGCQQYFSIAPRL